MERLRQFAPLLALLLALVVGGETTTDVLPCADAECGLWHALLHTDASPPNDGGHEDHASPTACLCHATFVSTASLPAAPAPAPGGDVLWGADPPGTGFPVRRVPHPPPQA